MTRARSTRLQRLPGRLTAAACGLVLLVGAGCMTPGAVAPSTMPITGKYVALGDAEEASSCGYTILFLPIKTPKPVAALIEDMIKGRGGDALVEVTSSSSWTFYLLGASQCVEIRGKVVNTTR